MVMQSVEQQLQSRLAHLSSEVDNHQMALALDAAWHDLPCNKQERSFYGR